MQPYDVDPVHARLHGITGRHSDNWTPLINQGMTLPRRSAKSCDTYFYELGKRFYNLPPDRATHCRRGRTASGFGEPSGIDVGPESSGLVPTPEWRQKALRRPPGNGTSTAPGSRATRCRWRSGRARCS